jgi:hypothetical protein
LIICRLFSSTLDVQSIYPPVPRDVSSAPSISEEKLLGVIEKISVKEIKKIIRFTGEF